MQVGDLVMIKYDGQLALVCGVTNADSIGYTWVHLLNHPHPFRPERLEVLSESR